MISISQAIQALSGGMDSEQTERFITALEKLADCSCKGDTVYSPIGSCYPWQLPSGELFIPHPSQNLLDTGQVLSKGMGNGDRLKLTAVTTLDPENSPLNIAINRGAGGSFHALSGAGNELVVEFSTVAGREWVVTITPQVPTSYTSSSLSMLSLCPSLAPLSGENGKITVSKGLGGGQAFGKEPKPPSPSLPDNSLFYDVVLGIPALVGRTGLIRVTFDVSPNLDLGGAVIVADMLGLKASLPLWSLAYLSAIHDTAVSQIKLEYEISDPIIGGLVGRFIIPRFQSGADLLATIGGGMLSSISVNVEFVPD
jgi:hypothetical protein